MWQRLMLGLGLVTAVAAAPRPAVVWVEDDAGLPAAVDVADLQRALATGGRPVTVLRAAELAARDLDARQTAFVVLPYGAACPAAALPRLARYLKAGGAVVQLGAPVLDRPLFEAGGRWRALDAVGGEVQAVAPAQWDLSARGPQDALTMTGSGSDEQPYRFAMRDLKGFGYATAALAGLPATAGALVFEAKGDPTTPHVCLELRERDGSRWKAIVPLSPQWQTVRVHLASFVAYASPQRNRLGDHVRPAEVSSLAIGLVRSLVRGPAHGFELRRTRFCEALVGLDAAAASGVAVSDRPPLERCFGRDLAPRSALVGPGGLASPGRIHDATVGPLGDHPLCRGLPALPGRLQAWLLAPPARAAGQPATLFAGYATAPRWLPFLQAAGSGPVAALLVHPSGGIEAAVAIDRLAPSDAWGQVIGRLANYLGAGVLASAAEPYFVSSDVGPAAAFAGAVSSRSPEPQRVSWTGRLASGDAAEITTRHEAEVPAGQTVTKPLGIVPLDKLDWRRFCFTTTVDVAGAAVDAATWRVDVRATLRALCDRLVREGAAGGKFSGTSFIDHRGARALLGAYEVFGDRRYLDTAMAWGRAMLAEQRPDGGYRMGYGITSRGEECYVADGGEIGLGIARLVPYAEPPERERLLASLAAYLRFRDSFRVPGGGIGVGWCLTDYGKRPLTPGDLKEPTRILAPEQNTYTIGCTLACAVLHAALTGRAADEAAVASDADWLMTHTKSTLSGAFIESFVFAHALCRDPARQQRYAEFIRTWFTDRITANDRAWWINAAGRSALDLFALRYVAERCGHDPRVLVAMARATSAMCAEESPTSLHLLLAKPALTQDEWIYACFGGVGLAEVVEPLVTLRRLPAR